MSKTNYVLIHGQLVEVSDDVLMHWKYIKREKKNGRWVYYYDQKSADRADYEIAKRYQSAEKHTMKRQQQLKTAKDRLNKSGVSLNSKVYYGNQAKIVNTYKRSVTNLESAKAAQKKAYRKYKTRNIKNFAAKTISKGAVKVANVFSRLIPKKKK